MKLSWRMTPVGIQRVLFTSILLGLVGKALPSPSLLPASRSPSALHDDTEARGLEPIGVNQAIPVSPTNFYETEAEAVGTPTSKLPDDLSVILDGNSISPEAQRHLLSKRQVRNDYERFYLCLFTLFTNPECRQRAEFNNANANSNTNANIDRLNNFEAGIYNRDDSGSTTQFIPLIPTNQPQRPLSFLGLGLNGLGQLGQGLGLNRFQNNFQQQPLPLQQPLFDSNFFSMAQTPYPEPQVHRRPGPESLERQHTFYPYSTTQKTISTAPTKPSTTTQRYEPSTFKSVQASITTTKAQPIFEEFTSATFSPQDLVEVTASSSETDSSTSTQGLLDCNTDKHTPSLQTSTSASGLIDSSSTFVTQAPQFVSISKPGSSCQEQLEDASILFEKRFQMYGKLEEENRLLKSRATETEQQLQSYQIQTKYLQEALTSVQEDSTRFKRRVSQLERTNNDLQQQNGQLQHSVGDQKTQMNELKDKIKYLEDKLLRISRQNLPLTREIQRHQQEVRELQEKLRKLAEENRECRNQVYQIQLKQTNKFRESQERDNTNKFRGDDIIDDGSMAQELSDDSPTGSNSTEEVESTTSQSAEVTTEHGVPQSGELETMVPSSTSTSESPSVGSIGLDGIPQLLTDLVASNRQVGSAIGDDDNDAQYNPYLLRLPLFPRIFDPRPDLGYGQNQAYYRNL